MIYIMLAVAVAGSCGAALLTRWLVLRDLRRLEHVWRQPRRVEVTVHGPEHHDLPPTGHPAAREGIAGWFVVYYEAGKGWLIADTFDTYSAAVAEALKRCAQREENLRIEYQRLAERQREPPPYKPREYLVLPALIFRTRP